MKAYFLLCFFALTDPVGPSLPLPPKPANITEGPASAPANERKGTMSVDPEPAAPNPLAQAPKNPVASQLSAHTEISRWLNTITADLAVALVALIISIVALVYTIKAYLLKSGLKLRGTYVTTSDIACSEPYISNVLIENNKDRAVVVLKIFLRLGANCYLDLADFESNPLIIQPFEAYKKELPPVTHYLVNLQRVTIRALLEDKKIKKRLVLQTTSGKYEINTRTLHWEPIVDFFKNYATTLIVPLQTEYNGDVYGDNIRYVIELDPGTKPKRIVYVYTNGRELPQFRDFEMPPCALKDRSSLAIFLDQQRIAGRLNCSAFTVHDPHEKSRAQRPGLASPPLQIATMAKWKYIIFGRFGTLVAKRKMKASHAKLAAEHLKKANKT